LFHIWFSDFWDTVFGVFECKLICRLSFVYIPVGDPFCRLSFVYIPVGDPFCRLSFVYIPVGDPSRGDG
jgi:hypothetical protein